MVLAKHPARLKQLPVQKVLQLRLRWFFAFRVHPNAS